MGKIFKALEKSKREQKRPVQKSGKSLSNVSTKSTVPHHLSDDRKVSQNVQNKKITPELELNDIHPSLNDGKTQKVKSSKNFSLDTYRQQDDAAYKPETTTSFNQQSDIATNAGKNNEPNGGQVTLNDENAIIKSVSRKQHPATHPKTISANKSQSQLKDKNIHHINQVENVNASLSSSKEPDLFQEKKRKPPFRGTNGYSDAKNEYKIKTHDVTKKPKIQNGIKAVTPESIDSSLVTFTDPRSYEAEQFKKLRTNILFSNTGKHPRSLLITSALQNEGKSFVSANLAISIAQNINEYVLLIDCDMRNPTIHKLFGYANPPSGLSEYLNGQKDMPSVLLKSIIPKLSILSSGFPPPNPSELLSSKRMQALLKETTERYSDRYVIIDSPPPQMTAETKAIAGQVDGVLLVINCGVTDQESIENTIDIIGRENIIGVVLNRFESASITYRYGIKYKYHGKHGNKLLKRK